MVIDPGSVTQREETRTIVAFGSIVVDRPLAHPHSANTPVHILVPMSSPGGRAVAHQWPLYDPSVTQSSTHPITHPINTSSHTLY